MTKFKRLLAAALSLVMLLLLTGCGNGVDVLSFRDTLAAVNALESFSFKTDAELSCTVQGNPGEIKLNGEGDVIISPLTMGAKATLDMGELGSLNFPMYITGEDEERTLYFGLDLGDKIHWTTEELDGEDEKPALDLKTMVNIYLCIADSVTCAGADKVGNVKATRYDFTVTRDAVGTIISQLKLEEKLRKADSDFDVTAMAKALDDISGSFWISDSDKLPLRVEIELNTLAQSLVDSMLKNLGGTGEIKVDSLLLNVYFENFNGVKTIKLPADLPKDIED